jgi:hypothetical protein
MGVVENIVFKRVDSNEELALSMTDTPFYILNNVDWGVVQGTHHSYKYVNQIGVSITSTSLKERSITVTGWIIADNEEEMDERKQFLNRYFDPRYEIDVMYKNYFLRFVPDNTVKYGTSEKENNDTIVQFQIKGTCADPLFSEINGSKETIAATIATFHFPLIMSTNLYERGIVFGYRQPSLTAKVTNKGAVEVGMKIVFKAIGELTNPRLIDVDTREFVAIEKSMVAGEEIVINTNVGEKSIQGKIGNEDYSNYFMYKDLDSTWLQLRLGDNLFRYDADSGLDNLEVYLYFYNKYLEVQECK